MQRLHVAEGLRHERLADADGAEHDDVAVGFEEAYDNSSAFGLSYSMDGASWTEFQNSAAIGPTCNESYAPNQLNCGDNVPWYGPGLSPGPGPVLAQYLRMEVPGDTSPATSAYELGRRHTETRATQVTSKELAVRDVRGGAYDQTTISTGLRNVGDPADHADATEIGFRCARSP